MLLLVGLVHGEFPVKSYRSIGDSIIANKSMITIINNFLIFIHFLLSTFSTFFFVLELLEEENHFKIFSFITTVCPKKDILYCKQTNKNNKGEVKLQQSTFGSTTCFLWHMGGYYTTY